MSEVVHFKALLRKRSMNQRAQRSIAILLLVGCTTGRKPITSPSVPSPPQPIIESSDNGPWVFAYRSDTIRYRISRSAAIEAQTDSGIRREITTNNTHEVLSLSVSSDTVHYSAAVDTFSTGTQGSIGSVPQISVPVEVSGVIDSISAAPDSLTSRPSCNPVESSLRADVRNLLIKFPTQLAIGLSWRDSTTATVCYGTIPLQALVIRRFSVVGKTSYAGQGVVAIQRADTVSAHGEGRQQQHQLLIDAIGTGAATYFISPEQGLLSHLTANQDIDFVIRTSARTSKFRESVKQEYSLVR